MKNIIATIVLSLTAFAVNAETYVCEKVTTSKTVKGVSSKPVLDAMKLGTTIDFNVVGKKAEMIVIEPTQSYEVALKEEYENSYMNVQHYTKTLSVYHNVTFGAKFDENNKLVTDTNTLYLNKYVFDDRTDTETKFSFSCEIIK